LVRIHHDGETKLPEKKNIGRNNVAKSVGTIGDRSNDRSNEERYLALGNGSSVRTMCRVHPRIVLMSHLLRTPVLPMFDGQGMRVRATPEIGCDGIKICRRLRNGRLSTTIRSFETCRRSVRRS
jgi:hypothetical protein